MNVVLIGYRGTGKSTVARLLAERLGAKAVDADDLIEQAAGCTIREIFERDGEGRFRDFEEQVLSALSGSDGIILAAGGGAVLREANRKTLCELGKIAWLTADVETILQRTRGDASTAQRRPNLTTAGGPAEVEQLLARREPLYRACADFEIDTSGKTPDEVAYQIEDRLGSTGGLSESHAERHAASRERIADPACEED